MTLGRAFSHPSAPAGACLPGLHLSCLPLPASDCGLPLPRSPSFIPSSLLSYSFLLFSPPGGLLSRPAPFCQQTRLEGLKAVPPADTASPSDRPSTWSLRLRSPACARASETYLPVTRTNDPGEGGGKDQWSPASALFHLYPQHPVLPRTLVEPLS